MMSKYSADKALVIPTISFLLNELHSFCFYQHVIHIKALVVFLITTSTSPPTLNLANVK